MKVRSDLLPSLGLVFGAAVWGLYWIPVRGIEAAGVHTFWTGPVIFGATCTLILPLIIWRLPVFFAHWRRILLPGLLTGSAFALYIASLNLTEVVRAILLFYMTPLWSTLLGVLILKERLTINRVFALLLACSGLYVVLVAESGLPIPRNAGDWFALISGICWSFASVRLFQDGARQIIEKVFTFIVAALLLSLILLKLHQGDLQGSPSATELRAGWYWILIVGAATLPICYLTLWPATLLSPARVGMLLMAEVIVGVVSAALLTDEPFGLREIAGTVLILSAGVVEVMRQQSIANSGMINGQA